MFASYFRNAEAILPRRFLRNAFDQFQFMRHRAAERPGHQFMDQIQTSLIKAFARHDTKPEVVDAIAALRKPVVDLSTEVIPQFLGRMLCVETRGYHRDIGSTESLDRARLEFPRPCGAGYPTTQSRMME